MTTELLRKIKEGYKTLQCTIVRPKNKNIPFIIKGIKSPSITKVQIKIDSTSAQNIYKSILSGAEKAFNKSKINFVTVKIYYNHNRYISFEVYERSGATNSYTDSYSLKL